MSGEWSRPLEIGRKPIPSKRLDQDIREAVARYGWNGQVTNDDPLLRIVLLCRARSDDWSHVLKKVLARVDLEEHHEKVTRHLVGDSPSAVKTRDGLYEEMASRLIDPSTFEPVDIAGMGPITLAREVADGHIQLEYIPATDDARERI